jgi:WD40 repeat protein
MNRRQFHQTITATAAALAWDGERTPAAPAGPASLPALDPLPAGAAARLGCNRLWHLWPASNPGLNDLTFSHDGRYLATLGYQDDHVFIWSVPDGRPVRDWEPQLVDRGGNLLWTEQGLYVASNGGLSLWEPLTATLIHRFTDQAAQGLARSPDGRWLAATSYTSGTVELWDRTTYQPLAQLFAEIDGKRKVFPDHGDFLLSVSFSRCGRWLAAGGYSHGMTGLIAGIVHCWDLAARRHLIRFFTKGSPVGELAFTPTGHLLTADWHGTVALWEPLEGRLVRDWPPSHTGSLYHSLAVNVAGQIALQRENGVYLWHLDAERETMLCPGRGFGQLAYSDDGRFIAGGVHSGRVDLFDAATGADLSPPDRHTAQVWSIELTADGTICLACLGRVHPHYAEIVLRDMRTGARLGVSPPADWLPMALAPVGTRIAGRLKESRLAVWDWGSGDVTIHPELDPQILAWHPDGQTLVVVARNGEVASWNSGTGLSRRQPVSRSVPMKALAVAASGRAAALSGEDELLTWQVDRDDPPHRLAVPPQPPQSPYFAPKVALALAPDGQAVALTYGDGIVYAGSVADGELRPVYTHPPGDEGVEDGNTVILEYTPARRLLIAGTCTALRDHKWWHTNVVTNALSGELLWRSRPERLWSTALALSPDGQALLTGHEDGTLLVWPLGAGS